MKGENVPGIVLSCTVFAVSAFGYELVFFLMTVLAYRLAGNALDVGIFTALTFLPRLFSPALGAFADRVGRMRCFRGSCIGAGIFLFLVSCTENIVLIGAFWLSASVFLTFIVNLRGSLTAEIVSRGRYAAGNSFGLSILSGARLIGPALGGPAVMHIGPAVLIRSACMLYLAAAFASVFIVMREDPGIRNPEPEKALKKGTGALTGNRMFGLLASIAFLWRLFLGMQSALFVVYVGTTLGRTDAEYGFFLAVLGTGSIAGSLLGPLAVKRLDAFRLIAIGMGSHYASFIALGFCGDYAAASCLVFAGRLSLYLSLVGMHTLRDEITPPGVRSGSYGAVTAVLTPAGILSMLAGSFLAGRFGAAPVLSGAGMLAFFSLFAVLFNGRKSGVFDVKRPEASRS